MTVTSKKLSAAAIGMPLAVVVVYGIEIAATLTVPGEVGAALGGVFTFVASVLIPDNVEE